MDKKRLFLILGAIILLIGFASYYYIATYEEVTDESDIFTSTTMVKSEVKNSEKVFVDVKGAVKKPGVYEMSSNDKVIDAINVAGGLKSNASTSNINLSKQVSNEMVIYVFTKSEITTKVTSSVPCECETISVSNCISNNDDSKNSNEEISAKININKASKDELMSVKGLGESKAEAIISYRTINGEFKDIVDIKNVSGIGEALFDKIKDFITV